MSTVVSEISASDVRDWDDYVGRHPDASAYHAASWKTIIENVFQRETHYLAARRDNQIVGVLPLIHLKSLFFGSYLISLPYLNYGGVLSDDDAAAAALLESAQETGDRLGVGHIEFRHTSSRFGLPARLDKVSMILALPDSREVLLKNLGSKKRSQIRRPEKEGATWVSGGMELLDEFYFVLCRKYRDLGVPVYPKAWFASIVSTFSDTSRIFVARVNSSPAAASIVLRTSDSVMEVPWAGSLRFADRFGINMYLYWQMIEFAMDSGCESFDFGRCTEGSGTYRFKKQWGAEPIQLYWEYWLPNGGDLPVLSTSNPKYDAAVRAWRKMPLWVTNTVGPSLVKNLP